MRWMERCQAQTVVAEDGDGGGGGGVDAAVERSSTAEFHGGPRIGAMTYF
jgi:hypothetical protein